MRQSVCMPSCILISAIILFLHSSLCSAGLIYAHDSLGNLFTVDVQTRVADLIGKTGRIFTDIAFDKDGNLFGISSQAFYRVDMGLYRIDPETAAVSKVGDLRAGGYVNALVFDEEGTLWAASDIAVVTLSPLNGAASFFSNGIGKYGSAGDLAQDLDMNMYLTTDAGVLVRIDRSSGAVVQVGKMPQTKVYGLITAEDGQMYGLTGDNQILQIDPQTGAAEIMGPIQASFALGETQGAAYKSACIPEPATLFFLIAGTIFAGIKKRA